MKPSFSQLSKGGKKKKKNPGFQPDLSLLQLIRIPFIFILSTVPLHHIHPHCHYSSLHAMCVLCRVRLFVTPRTVARQAPLRMGFPRQEYWSGLIFPSLGNLPDPGIEPASHWVSALADFLSVHPSSWGHCKLTSGFWKQQSIFPPLHPFLVHSAPSARV